MADSTAAHCARMNTAALWPSLAGLLGPLCPPCVVCLGAPPLLSQPLTGVFCSARCPGLAILRGYDAFRSLRESGSGVVCGFHAPVERDGLPILLRGAQPVVVALGRGVEGLRVPAAWRAGLAAGRLAVVSPFGPEVRRLTRATASFRNRFAAALSARVLILHAAPGGETEALAREALGWGKPVFTLDVPENAHLLALGARPF